MQRTRSTNEEEDDYHHSNILTLTRTNDYHYYQIHTGSVFHVLTRSQSRRTLRIHDGFSVVEMEMERATDRQRGSE
ncbi:hypothetical protein V9T40_001054 [Parthenolecanium corni]|uniref:Uncharacterized protein n=1 Tax=Parthenolecanium corni TaxID=536013 RepID=A0AAN9TAX3_9HEMI